MQILLIEDNPSDVMLVEEALREHKVAAELAVLSDGEEAYLYWDKFSGGADAPTCPDLVLLDINLPKRNGLEILGRIRETGCANVGVIIVSSSIRSEDLEKARAMGVFEYFRKPTHLDPFLELGLIVKNFQLVRDQIAGTKHRSGR